MSEGSSDEIKTASVAAQGGTVPKAQTSGSDLDYTEENPKPNQAAPQVGGVYDPRPHEDRARRRIAYLLIGLLWLIVSGILILLSLGYIEVKDIKDFGVVLSPVIALVSAATGFYYGTKSNSTGVQ